MRGGVSNDGNIRACRYRFSPRAWRCFSTFFPDTPIRPVFSTCVEVFLAQPPKTALRTSFLHVRGGVSLLILCHRLFPSFSPRAWRCFFFAIYAISVKIVFSTCVEVFPDHCGSIPSQDCFLHVRGGVSSYRPVYEVFQ